MAVGFPCPRTYLYESLDQLAWISDRESFPLVIKPRFTSGGRGMAIVRDREGLLSEVPRVAFAYGNPMIQEYIPGGQRDSVQFVVDRSGQIVFCFQKRRIRTFRRTARFGTVSESVSPEERLLKTAPLVRQSGWWGAMGIETIRDPRDGQDKLMEINPRFPRQVWNRTELGINEPLMCIRIARRERVDPIEACPPGVLFVSPVEDVGLLALQLLDLGVYLCRTKVGRQAPLDALCAPLSVRGQIRSFARTYSSRQRKIWDPYFRHVLQDPLTSALWWLQFSTWLAGGCRQLGR
jgi:predicted ATP-grasp superfamily ATP-dependent carboligase